MVQMVESPAQPFTVYDVDATVVRGHTLNVARNGTLSVLVHRWETGGEIQLHCHPYQDAAWTVLEGRVTFYGDDGNVMADLGRHQGIFVPAGTYYWFESTGDGELLMTRISNSLPETPRGDAPVEIDQWGRLMKDRQ
ncbi:MAG: cupin protein [Chloroflexi bacterium]|nr:cupin protein [Chloroflexota bacterium]